MAADFTGTIERLLSDTGTEAGLLTLEMTESVFVQDSERADIVLGDLKKLGVNLALDDFGTGYSSLTYLKRFPIDIVKIDRGVVADMNHETASHAIVSSVIDLAHLLGMTVVAEGVETSDQHEQLVALGCDHCQGYFFAPPMSADEFHTLIQGLPTGVHLPAGVSVDDHVSLGSLAS